MILIITACGPSIPNDVVVAMDTLPDQLDFNIHVKPIISDRCYACHGPDKAKQKAGLRLDDPEFAFNESSEHPGQYALSPGNLSKSQFYNRIVSQDPELIMPPPESNLTLSIREKAILTKWIKDGAEYKLHWAFIPPLQATPPTVDGVGDHPVDQFVIGQLEKKGWAHSEKAEKSTLLRRVHFDLTGLPPTSQELDQYLTDASPSAFHKIVDRLLASPQYGERMATDWMDVARYADTHGYTVDRYRDMSPWRDWVIQSFNDNMAYDQFVTWQMAGDLMPDATREQRLATGFNRNHQQNMEGGIIPEEYRVEYVADRTNTLGTAFLGMTFECARCHDHKYDPISQKNYFELFSFFNNVNEAGQISWNDATPVPGLLLTDEKIDDIIEFINGDIRSQQEAISNIEDASDDAFNTWIRQKRYDNIAESTIKGHTAHYSLDNSNIYNRLASTQKGVMKQQYVNKAIPPQIINGNLRGALQLDGDAWLDLGKVGSYDRSDPFTISLWVNIPSGLEDGVLFHKGIGAALHNYRGYHLALKDNRLELLMAHTAPNNAIIEYLSEVPRDRWIHLAATYDGSSAASGLKLYLNGQEQQTDLEIDNLYKTILFHEANMPEPGLQIGARWRGIGAKGTFVDEINVFEKTLTAIGIQQLYDKAALQKWLSKEPGGFSQLERGLLKEYYLSRLPSTQSALQKLENTRRDYYHLVDTIPEVMVMEEMSSPRKTNILERGLYDAPGEQVSAATPASILQMPDDLPPNRHGLAQWLTHPDNPLTARVYVNRVWQMLFGRGIVRTAEDFGNQGALPSHPELLDWLSIEFIKSGWDIKYLIKLIVTSDTYQQSSIASDIMMANDPENIYLSRGPSSRLSAEMLRDNVLAASGLLVNKIGGKSVFPYQPDDLWVINGGKYQNASGEDLYRRSMYTIWKRTVPHPSQATFDAPSRSNCTVRRQKTSTPLQALVLLNDPIYNEAAKVLGEQISLEGDLKNGIRRAFQLLTGRKPELKEIEILIKLQKSEFLKFTTHPEKMEGWLASGDYNIDVSLDPAVVAANTIVASTLINTDATMIKR